MNFTNLLIHFTLILTTKYDDLIKKKADVVKLLDLIDKMTDANKKETLEEVKESINFQKYSDEFTEALTTKEEENLLKMELQRKLEKYERMLKLMAKRKLKNEETTENKETKKSHSSNGLSDSSSDFVTEDSSSDSETESVTRSKRHRRRGTKGRNFGPSQNFNRKKYKNRLSICDSEFIGNTRILVDASPQGLFDGKSALGNKLNGKKQRVPGCVSSLEARNARIKDNIIVEINYSAEDGSNMHGLNQRPMQLAGINQLYEGVGRFYQHMSQNRLRGSESSNYFQPSASNFVPRDASCFSDTEETSFIPRIADAYEVVKPNEVVSDSVDKKEDIPNKAENILSKEVINEAEVKVDKEEVQVNQTEIKNETETEIKNDTKTEIKVIKKEDVIKEAAATVKEAVVSSEVQSNNTDKEKGSNEYLAPIKINEEEEVYAELLTGEASNKPSKEEKSLIKLISSLEKEIIDTKEEDKKISDNIVDTNEKKERAKEFIIDHIKDENKTVKKVVECYKNKEFLLEERINLLNEQMLWNKNFTSLIEEIIGYNKNEHQLKKLIKILKKDSTKKSEVKENNNKLTENKKKLGDALIKKNKALKEKKTLDNKINENSNKIAANIKESETLEKKLEKELKKNEKKSSKKSKDTKEKEVASTSAGEPAINENKEVTFSDDKELVGIGASIFERENLTDFDSNIKNRNDKKK